MENKTKVIEIPVAKLGTKPKLVLSPGLRELAEAYLYRKIVSEDLKNRTFSN